MSKIDLILKKANKNRLLSSKLRRAYISELRKLAQEGILQEYQSSNSNNYDARKQVLTERGSKGKSDELYGVNPASYGKPDISSREISESLSTRYVPGKPGVSAERVIGTNGGIYKDPITNKIYDWNEGFTDENGHKYNGSNVQGQTEIFSYSSICNPIKLIKKGTLDSSKLEELSQFASRFKYADIYDKEGKDLFLLFYESEEDLLLQNSSGEGFLGIDEDNEGITLDGSSSGKDKVEFSIDGLDKESAMELLREYFILSESYLDDNFSKMEEDYQDEKDWNESRLEYLGMKESNLKRKAQDYRFSQDPNKISNVSNPLPVLFKQNIENALMAKHDFLLIAPTIADYLNTTIEDPNLLKHLVEALSSDETSVDLYDVETLREKKSNNLYGREGAKRYPLSEYGKKYKTFDMKDDIILSEYGMRLVLEGLDGNVETWDPEDFLFSMNDVPDLYDPENIDYNDKEIPIADIDEVSDESLYDVDGEELPIYTY